MDITTQNFCTYVLTMGNIRSFYYRESFFPIVKTDREIYFTIRGKNRKLSLKRPDLWI